MEGVPAGVTTEEVSSAFSEIFPVTACTPGGEDAWHVAYATADAAHGSLRYFNRTHMFGRRLDVRMVPVQSVDNAGAAEGAAAPAVV